jgi:ribosomal protein S3
MQGPAARNIAAGALHCPPRLRVDICAARPILVAGHRGAEADRLRGELEELTGRRVRLDIREGSGPQEGPGSEGH